MALFAVRSLYRWPSNWIDTTKAIEHPHLYEERIVLFEASSDQEALEAALKEAEDYAIEGKVEFLKRLEAYRYDQGDREVFSTLRLSRLDTKEFKKDFYRDIDNHDAT